jgi:7-cyano-7-deazaguanine synthase in queuosine biosynthesis
VLYPIELRNLNFVNFAAFYAKPQRAANVFGSAKVVNMVLNEKKNLKIMWS